jgi:hypothetical protein
MSEYLIQFETRPIAGQEREYNSWYDNVHVPDVLSVPGFKSGKRYEILENKRATNRYLAVYTAECDDPNALLERLQEASKSMMISPSLDLSHVTVTVLKPR